LLRFSSPFFGILALAFLFMGAGQSEKPAVYTLTVVLVLGCLGVLAIWVPRLRRVKVLSALGFFLVSNAAVLCAWLDLLLRRKSVVWRPTERM
jgi:hypothetical protein